MLGGTGMAKFCKNCGTMAKDSDMVCTQCGTALEAPQKDAADRLFKKIGIAIGVIVLVTIAANLIIANTGYRGAIKKMVKYFEAEKTEKLVRMSSELSEEMAWGFSDYDEYCEQQIENSRERIEDEIGSIKKISYEIYSVEKMNKDEIKEAKDYFDELDIKFSADKVYKVSLSLTIKGSEETKDYYTSLLVLKEDGGWKLYNGGY